MANTPTTLETMPTKLDILEDKINRLVALVEKLTVAEPVHDEWMDVNRLCSYHPDRPAKKTVYDWVTLRRVPYHKDGKRLRFLKSEIDAWLAGGYHKTDDEMQEAAVSYVNAKREGRI